MRLDRRKLTLLGPAGTLEMGKSVLASGADAVFAGLKGVSRRGYDQELNIDEVHELCDYALNKNKKVRIAVNTYPAFDDMPNLLLDIEKCYNFGVSGIIVNDLGICALLKKEFPGICIYASVGTSIYNILDAKAWEACGADGLVLLCNLSPQDVLQIHKRIKCELEVLVHANKDFTYLGKCWISSYCASRKLQHPNYPDKQQGSPNMGGICFRVCRREWNFSIPQMKNVFKTDLPNECCMLSSELVEYVQNGVSCLKIQGREYSIELICNMIRFYRKLIDNLDDEYYFAEEQNTKETIRQFEHKRDLERKEKTSNLIQKALEVHYECSI